MVMRLAMVFPAFFMACALAWAEPITFGTSRAGSTVYSLSLAMAKEAGEKDGLDIRVVPLKNPTQVLPKVNAGEMQLGAAGAVELGLAINGAGFFQGKPMENLVAIGNVFPFRMVYGARKSVETDSIGGLKGLKIPFGFKATSTGQLLMQALIEGAGLSFADVKPVEVTGFSTSRDAFADGRTDVFPYIVGTPQMQKIARTVGPLKALSLPGDPDADARVKKVNPAFRIVKVPADPENLGREGDVHALAYDYVLYAHKDAADDLVEKMAALLVDDAEKMAAVVPAFKDLDVERVALDVGVPLHPAARKFYEKRGLVSGSQ